MTRALPKILAVLLSLLIVHGAAAQGGDQTANADDLLNKSQQALAIVVSGAKKDQSLAAADSRTKPFWDGLKDLHTNIANSREALQKQDSAFFTSLASANAAYVQAEIALIMLGNQDQRVASGMNALGDLLSVLNENFSKEAARLKQGGELTESEQQQLDKLIAQQDQLLKKLEEVEKNVAKNNAEMQAGIAKIRAESKKIRNSRRTVGGFVGGFISAHIMYDWLWGWHWWWGPWGGWCPGFIDINIIIWDSWVDDFVYDWALAEAYVDIADLEMELILLEDVDMAESLDFLESGDFGFDDDLDDLTSDLEYGWDDVETEIGQEIEDAYESNFDNYSLYEQEIPVETFDDYGMGDFDDAFGGMDDWGDY